MVAALALATDTFVYSVAIPVLPRLAARHHLALDSLGLLFGTYA
ncbi:MAG: MFS transporter, partial [Myxococcales bacterium]